VRGKYDVALLTYEMFLNLIVKRQGILNRIGVVVVDEAQFIMDPGRGISVELLLTYLLTAHERGITPQLLALSAVIGNINDFEYWLHCRALVRTQRPVPLEEGVIDHAGVFEYVNPATSLAHTRQLLPVHAIVQRRREASSQDVIVPLAKFLLAQQPTAKLIIFRNVRGKAEGVAGYLVKDLGLPSAEAVLATLPAQDQSSSSVRLREHLRGGTAFHNSNLSREEREAVSNGSLATWVLRLLAQITRVPRTEVATLLANTYGGYVTSRDNPNWRPQMDGQVERIIHDLLQAGITEQEGPLLQLTIVGFACANSTLSFESVLRLLHLLRQMNPATATLTRLLALTQALPELDDTYTPLFKNGTKEKTWPHHAAVKLGSDVVRLYQGSLPDATAYLRRAKRALIVAAWLEGVPMETLEQTYTNSPYVPLSYGDVRRIVDATHFHLRSVVPIVQALHPALLLEEEALNELTTQLGDCLFSPCPY
jgi:hypothetical protein